MPATDHAALCVRVWEYSETSQTACLLTRDLGLLRVIAKGSRRDRSPFSGGLELITAGDASVIVKDTGALSTLTEWDLRETFGGVRGSLSAFRAAMYSADLVLRLLGEGDPHPSLYDQAQAAWREFSAHRVEEGLLRFQMALLGETGLMPQFRVPESAGEIVWFVPNQGRVLKDMPADPDSEGLGSVWPVRVSTMRVLLGEDAGSDDSGGESLRRSNRLLGAYLRGVLGREPEAMRAVFGENPVPR